MKKAEVQYVTTKSVFSVVTCDEYCAVREEMSLQSSQIMSTLLAV